jgi:hypothetical protein
MAGTKRRVLKMPYDNDDVPWFDEKRVKTRDINAMIDDLLVAERHASRARMKLVGWTVAAVVFSVVSAVIIALWN